MESVILIILLTPLTGFIINSLAGKRLSSGVIGIIGAASIFISFLFSSYLFFIQKSGSFDSLTVNLINWINTGDLHISFEFLIDPLSITMMLIVTGVGFLIHLYSIGYMKGDERLHTYFACMNLFTFSMLLLVMSANYLIMFTGWEGVGLCSYLLIGFWYKNDDFNYAARKAFIMNRIGDLGFLVGIIALFFTFGSLSFAGIFPKAAGMQVGDKAVVMITILMLIGATGKSAQIPLYTWLPDAMAGPTPVSALIHAATMVVAGVYMIARSSALFILAPLTMNIIVVIGLSTTLLAALVALYQNDIKKILAYSTISQLGYMFLALGLYSFSSSVFHLTTHSFFKALLFLSAGSVIHSLGGEQDIRKMGGLKKKLKITFFTFMIATFAISGIPPFSGFFSKDEILMAAFQRQPLLWVIGIVIALLTCCYMFRLLYLVFYCSFRGTDEQNNHIHESSKVMTVPLIILAILSLTGGFINIPALFGGNLSFSHYLSSSFSKNEIQIIPQPSGLALVLVSLILIAAIILITYKRFVLKAHIPVDNSIARKGLAGLLYNKFYIDEFYDFLVVKPFSKLSSFLFNIIEKSVIDPSVESSGKFIKLAGKQLRRLQTGNISLYVFIMILAIILILLLNFYII